MKTLFIILACVGIAFYVAMLGFYLRQLRQLRQHQYAITAKAQQNAVPSSALELGCNMGRSEQL